MAYDEEEIQQIFWSVSCLWFKKEKEVFHLFSVVFFFFQSIKWKSFSVIFLKSKLFRHFFFWKNEDISKVISFFFFKWEGEKKRKYFRQHFLKRVKVNFEKLNDVFFFFFFSSKFFAILEIHRREQTASYYENKFLESNVLFKIKNFLSLPTFLF